MASEILSTLLLEYEQKKRKAELDAENRKTALYTKFPELEEIEEKLMKDILKTLKNDNLCNIICEKNNLNPIIEYFSNN